MRMSRRPAKTSADHELGRDLHLATFEASFVSASPLVSYTEYV